MKKLSTDELGSGLYLRVELDVRTHGVHDNLLFDRALITDP